MNLSKTILALALATMSYQASASVDHDNQQKAPSSRAFERANPNAMFLRADANGDGSLSEQEKREFRDKAKSKGHLGIPVSKIDINADGFISHEEHQSFRHHHKEKHRERSAYRQERKKGYK